MYIETGGRRYPCTGRPVMEGETLRFTLPEGGPEALGDTVGLYTDEGFALHPPVDVTGYAQWEMQGDTLIITNAPEPGPAPEPEPPATQVTTDQLAQAVVELMFEIDQMKLKGGSGI